MNSTQAIGLALVCAASCKGRSTAVEADVPAPTVDTPAATAAATDSPPRSVRRIGPEDIAPLEVIDLDVTESRAFAVHKQLRPRVLMEGKNLWLQGRVLPAPNRGWIRVSEGAQWDTPTVEARLLDLESGDVVVTVSQVYAPTLGNVGLSTGKADIDGKPHWVLIHVQDGLVVPIVASADTRDYDLRVHPVRGDAWLFRTETRLNADGDEEAYTRYAHWTKLREPPPPLDRELPYSLERGDHSRPRGWLGATADNPVDAPMFVDLFWTPDDCVRVELRVDGGFTCHPAGAWAMTGGWWIRWDAERERYTPMNDITGEVHDIDGVGACRVRDGVTLDPPRAMLQCGVEDRLLLWSPERVVDVPHEMYFRGSGTWSDENHIHDASGEVPTMTGAWVDVSRRLAYRHVGMTIMTYHHERWAAFMTPGGTVGGLDLDAASFFSIPSVVQGCADTAVVAAGGDLVVFDCETVRRRSLRWEVVNMSQGTVHRLPAHDPDWIAWITGPGLSVTGIMKYRGKSRVVQWAVVRGDQLHRSVDG